MAGYTLLLWLALAPNTVAGKLRLCPRVYRASEPNVSHKVTCELMCRGLLSVEDIPFEESGEQTVILLPKALRIGNAIAKDILAEKLSASSIQDLEVDLNAKGLS